MIVLALLTVFLLLPAGIFAYEVSRVTLAQGELRAVTDAAVIAAAMFRNTQQQNPLDTDANAQLDALMIVQQNSVMNMPLTNATQSVNVGTDNMAVGACECWTTVVPSATNPAGFDCTTTAALGVQPAFGKMLGLPNVTVRATSKAGPQPLTGDICFVVDVSGSMQFGSNSWYVQRNSGSPPSYSVLANPAQADFQIVGWENVGAAFSNEGWQEIGDDPVVGNSNCDLFIPNPSTVSLSSGKFFNALTGQSQSTIEAAMVEAKCGNLESQSIYQSSGAQQVLGSTVTPQAGWQADYQTIAMNNTHPTIDEANAINAFITRVQNPGVYWSLVTFSDDCTVPSGTAAANYPQFTSGMTFQNWSCPYNPDQLPVMPVGGYQTAADNGAAQLEQQLLLTPAAGSTLTAQGINQAVANLTTGPGNHPTLPHTIILITDGVPNYYGDIADEETASITAAQNAGNQGIPIYVIGFWHDMGQDSAMEADGSSMCAQIAAADTAPGSASYDCNNPSDIQDILLSIAAGTVIGLHN